MRSVADALEHISDPTLREFARLCLENVPDYFWRAPASSTGDHHPGFTQAEGGLARHTLAAVEIAVVLLPAYPELEKHRDEILVALLLHDTCKRGLQDEGRTVPGHELLPALRYARYAELVGRKPYARVMRLVAFHMGQWGVLGPPPKEEGYRISPAEFVHLCDYIASSRGVEEVFAGNQRDAAFREAVETASARLLEFNTHGVDFHELADALDYLLQVLARDPAIAEMLK